MTKIYSYLDNIKVGTEIIVFENEEICLRYTAVAVSGIHGTEVTLQ
jgi:hypothetical protein